MLHPYGERGLGPKTSGNQSQNELFVLISWNFQQYIKNRNICDVKHCPALLLQIPKESECIWVSYGQKTTQKCPKMLFLAGCKTFKN